MLCKHHHNSSKFKYFDLISVFDCRKKLLLWLWCTESGTQVIALLIFWYFSESLKEDYNLCLNTNCLFSFIKTFYFKGTNLSKRES